jgi:hypothetical protein
VLAEMMQSRKGRGRNAKARTQNQGKNMIPHPPPIANLAITHSTKLRFTSVAAFAQTVISFQNLLDTLLFAVGSTNGYDLFQQVRIRAVEMWALSVVGTATSVQCEYASQVAGEVGDARVHSDTSMGIEPAHIRARPAARSGAALFQKSSNQQAFTITGPAGCVIDVELSFKGLPAPSATACQNVLVAATGGAWYFRGLDGLAIATTNFLPVFAASGTI